MSHLLICTQGHRWHEDDKTAFGASTCPHCGALAETVVPVAAASTGEFEELPPPPSPVRRHRDSSEIVSPSADRPGPVSLDEFTHRLTTSGAISAEQFELWVNDRSSEDPPSTVDELCRELIRENHLTPFQADVLREGRDVPLVLGDYTVVDEIGAGGMGQVFQAIDRRMDRRVALKLLPKHLSHHAGALGRFEREVHAAAQLQHEHIVTVYDVGEANGRQYFTMQYVAGHSLADELCNGPLENQLAVQFLEPVSRAVHAAHQQGVLHRDLKPHNVLIEKPSGRPLVADFGLAKLTEEDGALTRSGEVMGTPQYMSPEQSRDAAHVAEQSDVYSLGATLYHALTGRPPFQAATVVETLRQIQDQEPVSPRHLNAAVDRDLETICLKCLDKDPQRRYASAERLADDLRCYLDGRPITARPISRADRMWRWCRRNRLAASLLAATVVGFFVAFAAVAIGYFETSAAYRQSELSFRQGLSTVNDFFTRVSEEQLLNQPGLQPVRRDLLQRALDFYQQFLADRSDDPALQTEIAATYYRIGRIQQEIESPQAALDWYERGLRLHEQLGTRETDDDELLKWLGNTLNARGEALYRSGQPEEAIESFNEARDVRIRLVELALKEREFRRTLANTQMNFGLVQKHLGQDVEARQQYEQAQTLRQKLLEEDGDDWKVLRDLGNGYYNLANLLYDAEEWDAAESEFRQAIEVCQRLRERDADDFSARYLTGVCQRRLGDLLVETKRPLEAGPAYELAVEALHALAMENPRVLHYQSTLAGVEFSIGQLALEQGAVDAARQWLTAADQILAKLTAEVPENSQYAEDLHAVQQLLAELQSAANAGE